MYPVTNPNFRVISHTIALNVFYDFSFLSGTWMEAALNVHIICGTG
jgi:hypothetical protein